jgi:hypothetical protein
MARRRGRSTTRRKRGSRARRNGFWKTLPVRWGMCCALAARGAPLWTLAAIAGISIAVSVQYMNAPGHFRIRHVIHPPVQTWMGPDHLVGTSLARLDIRQLARELEQRNPSAKHIRVTRLWPDTVRIDASPRQAIAQLRLDKFFPIDGEGYVFSASSMAPRPALPIVDGALLRDQQIAPGHVTHASRVRLALSLLERLQASPTLRRESVTLVDVTDTRQLSFRLRQGIEVRLGAVQQVGQALDKLGPVLAKLREENLVPQYIDLRFSDPVIGPR